MIKQLSIATTSDGVIGYDGHLAFWCSEDLANFKKFTDKTVVIVGRLTAEEMLLEGMKPDARRPMVIVSADSEHEVGAGHRYVYRAVSLDDAIEMAESVAKSEGLLGWTIAGGQRIYAEFFASKHNLDVAYLATIDADQSRMREEAVVKLDVLPSVRGAIERRMKGRVVSKGPKSLGVLVNIQADSAAYSKTANADFEYLYDSESLDPRYARFNDGWLYISASSGDVCLHKSAIIGTYRERERASFTILCADDRDFVVRLDSGEPGLNYLQHIINKHCK